jgi:glycosyltransferase involved in cell wall biosynthesis
MNVLFLGYWNLNDPLTRATIFPNLKTLQEFSFVEKIVFVNTEREQTDPVFQPGFVNSKITYIPLFSKKYALNILTKINDFVAFPASLAKIVADYKIDIVIARGTPAGALAYLLYKKVKVPFLVESFEPHADYMVESKVWARLDPRYIFQKYWENKQKKLAVGIMPVAKNYFEKLVQEGVASEKIFTVPCGVDTTTFNQTAAQKTISRTEFRLPEKALIGIYAGRFGGLYLGEEAFLLYQGAFKWLADFYLLILTPAEYHEWANRQVAHFNLPSDKVFIRSVPHSEVSKYMAIANFAFATYKPGKFKAYLSPVKVGEYWAAGLPVILTENVGDEHLIVKNNPAAGVLFNPEHIKEDQYLQKLYAQLQRTLTLPENASIPTLAKKYRNFDAVRQAYYYFLEKYVS